MGGEEFAIFLSETEQDRALDVADRLRAAIADLAIPHADQVIQPTASFGMTQWNGADDLDQLIDQADEALYRAKHGGRNRVAS